MISSIIFGATGTGVSAQDSDNVEIFVVDGVEYQTVTESDKAEITVTTTSELGEVDQFVYDIDTKVATLNGKKMDIQLEKVIEEIIPPRSSLLRASNWDPVYGASYNLSFSQTVNSIGGIATAIGGVIGIATVTGLSLPSIATTISGWAGVVGLGSLVAGYTCSGSFKYQIYRTRGPVDGSAYGYPYLLTMYRYQNASVNFKIKGTFSFSHNFNKIGNWFTSSRPI